jgi:microcin C transport system substrate-binding protein
LQKEIEMGLHMFGKFSRLPTMMLALSLVLPAAAFADAWTNGISTIGELKYPPGFKHFDYVNPDAPKGGTVNLSELGTFDTLNPIPNKGNLATGAFPIPPISPPYHSG